MKPKKKEHLKLEKYSGLFFVISMVLVLATVYAALEWKDFYSDGEDPLGVLIPPAGIEEEIPPITVVSKPPPPKLNIPKHLEIIKDDDPQPETSIDVIEPDQHTVISAPQSLSFKEVEEEPEVTWITIEEVPVFPGCESSGDKRACFQEMVLKHIRKNFRYPEQAIAMNLQGKVHLQFTVKKDGSVGHLKMRSPHDILGNEAKRIISKLPKMQPGKQRDKAVQVAFSIPITFKLQ